MCRSRRVLYPSVAEQRSKLDPTFPRPTAFRCPVNAKMGSKRLRVFKNTVLKHNTNQICFIKTEKSKKTNKINVFKMEVILIYFKTIPQTSAPLARKDHALRGPAPRESARERARKKTSGAPGCSEGGSGRCRVWVGRPTAFATDPRVGRGGLPVHSHSTTA